MGRGAFKGAVQVDNLNDTVDVSDRDLRDLGDVEVTDGAGTVISPATEGTLAGTLPREYTNTDEGFASGAALAGNGETVVASLSAAGAESLHGQLKSTGAYDVRIDWKNSAGTVIREETIASAVTGGNWTDLNQDAKSPYADVVIVDGSGASQTADGTTHMG